MDRGELGTFSLAVVRYLHASGIRCICVGHKPAGDCPLLLRVDKGIDVINADLTRTDPSKPDGRGDFAVGEVLIEFNSDTTTRFIHGMLAGGERYAVTVSVGASGDNFVGKITSDGFIVRAHLNNGSYWLTKTTNRIAETKERSQDELQVACWTAAEGKL